jgi:hypothetical protein
MIIELGSIATETKSNMIPFTSDLNHNGLHN